MMERIVSMDFARLTPREEECLTLLAEGWSSKEIAHRWQIRSDSVDRIVLSARSKLNGLSRRHAVRAYKEYRQGLDGARRNDGGNARDYHQDAQNLGAVQKRLPDQEDAGYHQPGKISGKAGAIAFVIARLFEFNRLWQAKHLNRRPAPSVTDVVVIGGILAMVCGLMIYILDKLVREV
jgi:DNA-binding CsgD family transcriptional regulator